MDGFWYTLSYVPVEATEEAPIDGHFHVWDASFPDRPFPWTPDPFPVEEMTAVLDRYGIGRGVHVTPVMNGFDNDYGVEAAALTEGRIAVFGRVDPFAADPRSDLARWMSEAPAAGVRLTFYGNGLQRLVEEPAALDPFWAAAADLGIRVAVFAPDALWEIVRAVERHATLRLVVDHLGLGVYPNCPDPFLGYPALKEFAPYEQVLVKVSGMVEVSRDPYPFADMRELLAEAVERFGADRLIWGSNYPVVLDKCGYEEALRFVTEASFLTDGQRRQILGGTCARMLADVRAASA